MNNIMKNTLQLDNDGYIYATAVAKKYGKRLDHFFDNKETQEYIEALKSKSTDVEYVKTSRGRADRGGGTWISTELLVPFALWLGGSEALQAVSKAVQDHTKIMAALNDFEIPEELSEDYLVYAIREIDTGNIKIGISKDPERRLRQLQTGNSSVLELVGTKKAVGYRDESDLHQLNSEHHIHGEWFTGDAVFIN